MSNVVAVRPPEYQFLGSHIGFTEKEGFRLTNCQISVDFGVAGRHLSSTFLLFARKRKPPKATTLPPTF